MNSLSSSAYCAALGTNGNFLLEHSVGSIPHNSEIGCATQLRRLLLFRGIEKKARFGKVTRYEQMLS